MKGRTPEHCDRIFRYSLSGKGKELRFDDFELTGPLKDSQLDQTLRSYFVGRKLAEVSATDLPNSFCGEDLDCRDHILQHVLEVKRLLGRGI